MTETTRRATSYAFPSARKAAAVFPVTASAANTHASVPAFRRISRETHHYRSALPDDGCVYMYRDGKEWTKCWLVAPDGTQLNWERLTMS